jgi:parallel beta-helix repeat protein
VKRSTFLLVLLLLFSVVLVSFPQIGTVKAEEETIYIRANGRVEGTDRIQRVGNLYSFTSDINESIIVERENTVIDGTGYLLQGNNAEYGIKLESSGVTIRNMQISRFEYGVYVYLSSNNNIIVNNKISGTSRGIYVRGTDNNTITGNELTNNGEGIYLSATNSVLRNNQMENNSYNFGIIPQPRYNDIDTSNTVNGKPIYHWTNQHDKTVPLDAGCVILINCTNIKVHNLTLTNNKEGLLFVNANNIEIKNCSLSNNKSGIRTRISSNINITQNVFNENGEGLTIWESTKILLNENQIVNNTQRGIEFFDSKEQNSVKDNYISGSSMGIEFTASSNYNTITGNTITNCDLAILFTTSTFNTLRNNTMFDNKKAFHIDHGHYTDVSREIPYFINDVDSSNTIDGKPMYYWIDKQDKTVPSDAGYVVLMNCTNITVSNLQKVSTILVAYTNDSLISQNLIENSDVGIKIWRGSNNNIVANQLIYNEAGLSIHFSENNNAYWNNLSNNLQGVSLSGNSNNNIFRNVISNNHNGIYLDWANNNTIYNNNFVNNTRHVYDTTETIFPWLAPTSIHNWNQTYPIGGNYWSNFTGVDLKSGKNQNLTGSDGIIDAPYKLYINNTDGYPLTGPIIFLDPGIWEWKQYYVNCISNSTVSDFNFSPENALIQFDVEGEEGTTGFCRVTIPKDLLYAEGDWTVLVDGNSVTPTIDEDATSTYLYFTYNHSIKTVEIIGTDAIPEFPSQILLLVVLGVLAIALAVYRIRLTRIVNQHSERCKI